MSFEPEDEAARRAARSSRGRSLVLEAGAGTGKTTLLVDRIESLVRTGDASLLEVAAVTFTENAAATLKLRLRERLEKARADEGAPTDERARAEAALEVLERAQVSTIHAFCAAILQERPLECGVVPGFRVADEAESEALFARAWEEWLAERLDASDPVLAEALSEEIPLQGGYEDQERASLRGLARTLRWERDLRPLVADTRLTPAAWRDELAARAEEAGTLRAEAIPGDTLGEALKALPAFAESCRELEGEALALRLLRLPKIRHDLGRRSNWQTGEALGRARDLARWTGEAPERWRAERGARLHAQLVRTLEGVLTRYEEKKRAAGVLDFVDLLVKARDALRDRESVRRHVRRRFRHLIIDEFQDTDPLQVQIARALAGDEPGRLVVVGDAKQSIYRFRRADVGLFRALTATARERPGHEVLRLTQNFRSRPAILRFVNRAFAELIVESVEADQPAYEPIAPPPGLPEAPAVIALRVAAPAFAQRTELLAAEASATAAFAAQAAAGAYEVRDPLDGRGRPSRAGDVMVLAPRLTQVRYLEDALDAAGLACAVDGGKSFFNRQEVHEALATLRAIEDPQDRASLVAALRSCFFGVSDRDLVQCWLASGSLHLRRPVDEQAPGAEAVAPALALLRRLHERRLHLSIPALLETLYDETRVLAALEPTRRGAARVSNLEKVVALARQAGEVGVLTLRGFIQLLSDRVSDGTEEPDLPSSRPGDPSTVRILSIHRAKGLEAPIVVAYDLAASLQTDSSVIPLWEEGRVAVGFRAGCRPPDWKTLTERDKAKARAEGRRLLYVACTRARDLLVLPQAPADAQVGDFWRDLAPPLRASPPADVLALDAATLPTPPSPRDAMDVRALAAAAGGDAVALRWDRARQSLVEKGAFRPLVPVAATRAAAREGPPAVLAGVGGGGRDFGGLVHRILEWSPLDGAGEDRARAMAEALAPTFGVDAEGAARAAAAVARALALPVMDRARRAERSWRELPLWFPDGGQLVHGFVDLVFEEDGALVIVDYKTDHIAPGQALAQAAHHAPQLQLYGRGLAQATGLGVRERLVLFTALGQAVPV
jgi:ATP-dependent helicase/nuclease subunit A